MHRLCLRVGDVPRPRFAGTFPTEDDRAVRAIGHADRSLTARVEELLDAAGVHLVVFRESPLGRRRLRVNEQAAVHGIEAIIRGEVGVRSLQEYAAQIRGTAPPGDK